VGERSGINRGCVCIDSILERSTEKTVSFAAQRCLAMANSTRLILFAAAWVCSGALTVELARPWLDASLPIPQRVALLLANMTLNEKIAQLTYDCPSVMDWSTVSYRTTGIGSVGIECTGIPGDATQCDMSCRIANLRAFQLAALNETRLGIPTTFVIETSHCGAAGGTIFPMGVTQGSSWNVDLVGAIATAIALEARSWGGSRGLSPEINVVTDPRFGRTEENFGADPLLVTKMASAAVAGLQGGTQAPNEYLPTPNASISAEAKHCCAYGFSGLDGGAADVSPKTLHDVYFKPWRAFIRAGGSGMMMSHNEMNGVPMHANAGVIGTLFRQAWNYSGFVHSDYGNIGALQSAHIAANITQAAAIALSAGVDQDFMDRCVCVCVRERERVVRVCTHECMLCVWIVFIC
jgi:beta-glucosidase